MQTVRAFCIQYLCQMTNGDNKKMKHPHLDTTRINRDEEEVKLLIEKFCSVWQNLFERTSMNLCLLSHVAALSEDVIADIFNAEIGKEVWEIFKLRGPSEHPDLNLFDRFPLISFEVLPRREADESVYKEQ